MKATKQQRYFRILETVHELADKGIFGAQEFMRAKYNWSRATWHRYQEAALARLRANEVPIELERRRAIQAFEEIKRDPKASPNTRARCEEYIARIRGTFAPDRIDQRVVCAQAALPASVQQLLADPSRLSLELELDTRHLNAPEPV